MLLAMYEKMRSRFGFLDWWPGDSPYEVSVGAILTQNTAWSNAEKAIGNLKARRWLEPAEIRKVPLPELARVIKPAGYFNQKARKLKIWQEFLDERYGGDLLNLQEKPVGDIRNELLALWGLGPETVDSILLYALDKPVFVVDAYTKRILSRHRLLSEKADYHLIQHFFQERLPLSVELFNDFHAQIVYTGKFFCKTKPDCRGCPLF